MFARTCDRVKIAVPVQVLLQGATGEPIPALAVDASAYGARVSDFAGPAVMEQTLTLLNRGKQCRFRVVWVGEQGTPEENQMGIECLERGKDFWGIDFQDNSTFAGFDGLESFFLFPWESPRTS